VQFPSCGPSRSVRSPLLAVKGKELIWFRTMTRSEAQDEQLACHNRSAKSSWRGGSWGRRFERGHRASAPTLTSVEPVYRRKLPGRVVLTIRLGMSGVCIVGCSILFVRGLTNPPTLVVVIDLVVLEQPNIEEGAEAPLTPVSPLAELCRTQALGSQSAIRSLRHASQSGDAWDGDAGAHGFRFG
jgi:hypothetical protein